MKRHLATAFVLMAFLVTGSACMSERQAIMDSTFKETCGKRLVSVYFDEWQHTLNKAARGVITKLTDSLKGCKIRSVRIIGLADSTGDEAANLVVSQRRAETIAGSLAKAGWPRDKFELVAIGEKDAINKDGTVKPMRRRATIQVTATDPK